MKRMLLVLTLMSTAYAGGAGQFPRFTARSLPEPGAVGSINPFGLWEALSGSAGILTTIPAARDSIESTSTYYNIRRDTRRCASPFCGGYWVRRVNREQTRCADDRYMSECYVAEIDWNSQPRPGKEGSRGLLLRGGLVQKAYGDSGRLGSLRVTESWQAAGDAGDPAGAFYRVRALGVRCVTAPCLTHHMARLNSMLDRDVPGVDFSGVDAEGDSVAEASAAMKGPDGLLVAGAAGLGDPLRATMFYLRVK
jgi:hypothetical protein